MIFHQTCISQSLVVTNQALKLGVRGFVYGNFIVSQSLFILSEVVVTLTSVHVELSISTFLFDLRILYLFIVTSCFIQNGGTEIIKSSLVVVHHHVTLASLEVGHSKLWTINTRSGERYECLVNKFSLLFFTLFLLVRAFSTFSLLYLLHEAFTLLIVLNLYGSS